MKTSREINQMRWDIDKARINKMKEAMADYDRDVYYPALKELYTLCHHNWNFLDTNPIGYPIFKCAACGKTEIRNE
jgi:hypothetical protein